MGKRIEIVWVELFASPDSANAFYSWSAADAEGSPCVRIHVRSAGPAQMWLPGGSAATAVMRRSQRRRPRPPRPLTAGAEVAWNGPG